MSEKIFIPEGKTRDIEEIIKNPFFPFIPVVESQKKSVDIRQIYVNRKKLTTTVLWADGDHTTVKLNQDPKEYKPFDVYYAVCAALAKRVYGSNTKFKKIIEEKTIDQGKKRNK